MIIKSMSRKQPSFAQLLDYFHKEAGDSLTFVRNLYADPFDLEALSKEFEENYEYLPVRANGNALYHEVVVLEKAPSISGKRQLEILYDLVTQYAVHRAPDAMIYGRAHSDTDYCHFHLLISSNAVRSTQRSRLSKREFFKAQHELEAYKLEKYPELDHERYYDQHHSGSQVRDAEYQLQRRTKKPSERAKIASIVRACISISISKADFENELAHRDIHLYERGRNWGVIAQPKDRKFRIKTLGLEAEFKQLLANEHNKEVRSQDLKRIREQQFKRDKLHENENNGDVYE